MLSFTCDITETVKSEQASSEVPRFSGWSEWWPCLIEGLRYLSGLNEDAGLLWSLGVHWSFYGFADQGPCM
ncbi:hypothetical protein NFI96_021497 [Prochilodus magdalenae]|nr:hypothetical protein NFI96_021497 [Prochilodus magdalenae]